MKHYSMPMMITKYLSVTAWQTNTICVQHERVQLCMGLLLAWAWLSWLWPFGLRVVEILSNVDVVLWEHLIWFPTAFFKTLEHAGCIKQVTLSTDRTFVAHCQCSNTLSLCSIDHCSCCFCPLSTIALFYTALTIDPFKTLSSIKKTSITNFPCEQHALHWNVSQERNPTSRIERCIFPPEESQHPKALNSLGCIFVCQ